jgi:hypothetical protein
MPAEESDAGEGEGVNQVQLKHRHVSRVRAHILTAPGAGVIIEMCASRS